MRRRTGNVITTALRDGLGGVEHRQQHPKYGSSWLRFTFDDAAVIADNLGHKREAETAAGLLRRHKWIEQIWKQILGDALAIVLDAEFERKRNPRFLAWYRQSNTRAKGGRKLNFRIAAE